MTEAQILIAFNVNHIAVSIDDVQRLPSVEEFDQMIEFLQSCRESLVSQHEALRGDL